MIRAVWIFLYTTEAKMVILYFSSGTGSTLRISTLTR